MEQYSEEAKRFRIKIDIAVAVTIIFLCAAAFCSYSYGLLSDEEDVPRVIAHGGGMVCGYETTNSLEAVKQSIAAGYTMIELDMLLTADEKIVVVHDFGPGWTKKYLGVSFQERPTEEEFLQQSICENFTAMSFDMLTEVLDEHPDVRIVTDCKEDAGELLSKIAREYPDYVCQIVPQIYYYYQYEQVARMGYQDIILTLYSMNYWNYERLLSFVQENGLFAVTVGIDSANEEIAYRLAEDGVRVYMHPVNNFEKAVFLLERGIYGVYSSVLAPDELSDDERNLYFLDPISGKRLEDVTLSASLEEKIKELSIYDRISGRVIAGAGSIPETGNIFTEEGSEAAKVLYFVNGMQMSQQCLDSLPDGIHTLVIRLTESGSKNTQCISDGTEYLLYKGGPAGGKYLRIAEQKNGYRLCTLRKYPQLADRLSGYSILDAAGKALLLRSVIMAEGEYGYYESGELKEFRISKYDVITPKYDRRPGSETMVIAPASVQKRYAGRDYIAYENVLIYLPEGTKLTQQERTDLGKAAQYIFYDWNRAKEEIYATCI